MSRRPAARGVVVIETALLVAALCVAGSPAVASNPPAQTATVPSKTGKRVAVSWSGTILPGANPTSDCAAGTSPQDHHTIRLSVPAGIYAKLEATARFSITWNSSSTGATSDEILTVFGPNGEEISSSDGGSTLEEVPVKNPGAGTYDAVACGFANLLPQPYTGTLVITTTARRKAGCPAPGPKASPPAPHATGPRVMRDREAGIDCLRPITAEQQADTATEPSLAVNPEDPNNAVAVFQEGRVDGGCSEAGGWATTFDGGRSWRHGDLPGLTLATGGTVPLASDYVVAFGPNDLVYANSLLCGEGGLAVNVSRDGGAHWGKPVVLGVDAYSPLVDKNWIVVDTSSAPGHHLGRVYVVWDNVAPVFATYSDDQGQTWQPPSLVYLGAGIGSIPLVMPNGDLAVVFAATAYPLPPLHTNPTEYEAELVAATDREVVAVAHGAGLVPTGAPLVFAPPLTVGSYAGQDVRRQRAGEGLPTAGVDPRTGRIYVAWEDARYRTDLANDVVITWSDDGGLTWPAVRKVNPGRPDDYVDHFTPALAVGSDGSVRISYRVQHEAPSVSGFSPFVDTFYQESRDGGLSFTRPLKVNAFPTDVRFAAFSRDSAFLGDYSQVAAAGRLTYIVRCEAYRLSKKEKATFPPSVYHQRTWVAVVAP